MITYCQNIHNVVSLKDKKARAAPEWLETGIVYQIQLRAFTPEGTLKAATARLKDVAQLGATVIYLCPVFLADDDDDQSTWSPRQKASGMNNPRNPYRMADFYRVDPECGSDDDLKGFITECHRLGLRIMLDMVYLHCGSKAVFLKEHLDFIVRSEDGNAIKAAWNWPALNFENQELREYLWQNMEYWVKEFNVDGFRLDVASGVPLDFWEEARSRLEKIRPDIGMLAEAAENRRPEDQLKAFDANYSFVYFGALRDVFANKYPVSHLFDTWNEITNKWPQGARFIRYFDNHDLSNDDWYNRRERDWGFDGCNATFVHLFTLNGIPFIYNGQEVADTARHSIFGRAPIYWANGENLAGQLRFDFLKKLCEIRKTEKALVDGNVKWLSNDQPQSVLSYSREFGNEKIFVVINLSKTPLRVHVEGVKDINNKPCTIIIKDKIIGGDIADGLDVSGYGYWVGKTGGK
ncbi:MAG: hypothetical protein A2W90_02820 [Bacteroidetes bacterium GWF2_42_66]|nr:MAG: hypothetical protein A2W92_19860 [Bacteroidetes bacterium GWA2_42_15]OFY01280.1 MAG: hypothetical protein A2W89_16305 [Bacteroidetes bacterium GWE2_42_39]OFY42124.1 MAG: hypothetical protein A2W90_02820 [Bacteroidetes bacterium GWF2_42_66]